jgi:parvulin-like peptidyl-prolyl isomerase
MKIRGLCVVLSLMTVSCAPATWLAKVNGEKVGAADLEAEFVQRHGGHRVFLGGEVEARKFLDVVVDARLLIQEAYRLGLDEHPDIAKAAAEFRGRQAARSLLKAEVDDKARPTPAEVRAAWEAHTAHVYQAREIVAGTAGQAEAARARLAAGESFDMVAREVSIAPSRMFGGRLGAVGWGAQEPEWEAAVFALDPQALSPVFRTAKGWHVVQLESVRDEERPPFEKARARIEGILLKRKTAESRRAVSERLWAKYRARLEDRDRTPAALAAAHKETPEAVVAAWDGGALTVREFFARLDMRELATVPPGLAEAALEERMRAMVNEPLCLLEARARGLDRAPEIEEAARRFREGLMQGALYDGYVLKDVVVTDEEVRAFYDQHRAELVAPEKRRVSHILLSTREEAEDVKRRLDSGEAFDELVTARSQDAGSVKAGGDLGWIVAKDVPADFAPVLSLAEGEVAGPLPSKFGFHVVQVVGIVPQRPLEWEEAKADLRRRLEQQKRREKHAEWVDRLRAVSDIAINRSGVKAFARERAPEAQGPGPQTVRGEGDTAKKMRDMSPHPTQ